VTTTRTRDVAIGIVPARTRGWAAAVVAAQRAIDAARSGIARRNARRVP
jgi:hypothetical protein